MLRTRHSHPLLTCVTLFMLACSATHVVRSWRDPFYSPFWPSYYYNAYRLIERELAYVESNLYRADSSTMLMSVLTRTEDPNYSPRQIEGLADLLVQELRRATLVPPED